MACDPVPKRVLSPPPGVLCGLWQQVSRGSGSFNGDSLSTSRTPVSGKARSPCGLSEELGRPVEATWPVLPPQADGAPDLVGGGDSACHTGPRRCLPFSRNVVLRAWWRSEFRYVQGLALSGRVAVQCRSVLNAVSEGSGRVATSQSLGGPETQETVRKASGRRPELRTSVPVEEQPRVSFPATSSLAPSGVF